MYIKQFFGKDFNEFTKIINNIIDIVNKYPIKILYGYKWYEGGGCFLEILMKEIFNMKFDYIVDDDEFFYNFKIYKQNLFDYIDSTQAIILDASGKNHLNNLIEKGFREGKNYFNICSLYQLNIIGYIEYIEKKYLIEVSSRKTLTDVHSISTDAVKYGPSRSMSMPFLCQYLRENYPQQHVLDLGCGKGGAMIVFKDFGYKHVDGIEILEELATIAIKNLQKYDDVNISNVFCGDVLNFTNYDMYDLFYIYDAFRGETFRKVKNIIIQSSYRQQRKILVVYSNPFEHKIMLENHSFKLVHQLEGDWLSRFVNIYESV